MSQLNGVFFRYDLLSWYLQFDSGMLRKETKQWQENDAKDNYSRGQVHKLCSSTV
jgi:hypothetical protein